MTPTSFTSSRVKASAGGTSLRISVCDVMQISAMFKCGFIKPVSIGDKNNRRGFRLEPMRFSCRSISSPPVDAANLRMMSHFAPIHHFYNVLVCRNCCSRMNHGFHHGGFLVSSGKARAGASQLVRQSKVISITVWHVVLGCRIGSQYNASFRMSK